MAVTVFLNLCLPRNETTPPWPSELRGWTTAAGVRFSKVPVSFRARSYNYFKIKIYREVV